MERALITGWLVVEFPDRKEQTITFKRGWVCVLVGGGGKNGPENCEVRLLCSIPCPRICLSKMTFVHSKTLPHAAVVNQKTCSKTAVATLNLNWAQVSLSPSEKDLLETSEVTSPAIL